MAAILSRLECVKHVNWRIELSSGTQIVQDELYVNSMSGKIIAHNGLFDISEQNALYKDRFEYPFKTFELHH